MGEKAETRTARKLSRLHQVATLYRERVAAGSHRPSADVAEHLGVAGVTARSWIFRARAEGLLDELPEHRARPVDWGTESWMACRVCRVEWPCPISRESP